MSKNRARHGMDRVMAVDTSKRPVFGFGNSSTDRCMSTGKIGLTASGAPVGASGTLKVPTLDRGTGPILLSVESPAAAGCCHRF